MSKELKTFLKTTDRFVNILAEKGIRKAEDFFYYFPKDYEDRTEIKKISQLQEWVKAVIKAQIVEKNVITTPRWKKLIEFKLQDEDNNIAYANFLNLTHILRTLKKWNNILLSWKPKWSYGKRAFWFPEIINTSTPGLETTNLVWKIVPIYSDFLGIKWSWFQKKMAEKLPEIDNLFSEFLPSYLIKKYDLLDIKQALKNIHFPENMSKLNQAKYRFNFEQLLIWQLVSNFNFETWKKSSSTSPNRDRIKEFLTFLPFQLTNAQKRAIKAIIDDIHSWSVMRRLLQWDVWSWKTVVAMAISYYIIKEFKQQIAFLAPTEVLANQHLKNIAKIFLPLGINIQLLTGSTKAKEKEQIKQNLKEWKIDIIVWTHAIIQDDVIFKNLWLIIVDEQHKFWVKQRIKLTEQWNPHMLQMTATPIPRSLALSYFWEFENTIIDELPPWRQEIYTKVISEQEYENLVPFLINKIQQWQQIYIVVPLIEESEKMEELNSAMQEYEKVKELLSITDNDKQSQTKEKNSNNLDIDCDWNKNGLWYINVDWNKNSLWYINVWLMHWKLSSKDKDKVMKDFKEWKTQVLVSTTVIEVWVDVPQATIMIIKNAERFGLSALHQLRWRVGRNDLKSYCFLVTKSKSGESYRRLKYMEKYSDGFKLAEIDLQTRGAGTILWTAQSGEMDLPEEALKDITLLEQTRAEAKYILENNLLEKNPELKKLVSEKVNLTSLIG